MTASRSQFTLTLLPNGQVLAAGGYTPTINLLASAELYDPATGIFTRTGDMNDNRAQHTATLLTTGKVPCRRRAYPGFLPARNSTIRVIDLTGSQASCLTWRTGFQPVA